MLRPRRASESLPGEEVSSLIDQHTVPVGVGELTFPVVDCGEGEPVLLLHGFPDSRHLWRHQIPALLEAGYRVVAPDLRGFGEAPKPAEVEAYALPRILADVLGILDALGLERAAVVGHDWGAVVAWLLAAHHPERVERLVALSVGCPGNSGSRSIEQREKGWYVYFFQFEGVAEAHLLHDGGRLMHELLRGQGDLERYRGQLSQPGALTAALNWYRANLRPRPPEEEAREQLPDIRRPALGVWGGGDPFLTEAHVEGSAEKMTAPWRYERIDEAGHWLMLTKPAELNRLLLEFLGQELD